MPLINFFKRNSRLLFRFDVGLQVTTGKFDWLFRALCCGL